jgi:hypothetical protein
MSSKPNLYFYQDVAEKKSKDYIDAILPLIPEVLHKMEKIRAIKQYEVKYVYKPIKKHDLELGDFLLYRDNIFELAELKIDGDALSSLNKNHLQAQLQKMLTFTQIETNLAKEKGVDPPKIRLVLLIAFTKDYLDRLGGPAVFTLTKRIYLLKKQFPDIYIIMKSDGERTTKGVTKYIHAIVNAFMAWFDFLFSDKEIKPITVPQLERSVPKGPLFSIAAGVNGWTMDKASYIAQTFNCLQDVANAKVSEIESVLEEFGVPTHQADAMNLYEHFRKEFNSNDSNPDQTTDDAH